MRKKVSIVGAGKLQSLAQDLAMIQSMGVKIVLVHGFRPQVNEQLLAKGHAPKYSHGIRITDEVALDCAQEAAGQLRYEIEAAFAALISDVGGYASPGGSGRAPLTSAAEISSMAAPL